MHITYNKEFHLKHENWTDEIKDNFESFLTIASLLEYNLQKTTSNNDNKFNRHVIKLKSKNKLIVVIFDISKNSTIDLISVLTKTKDQVFTNNQFTEAISFMKSVL